jgi:hypothetical protein
MNQINNDDLEFIEDLGLLQQEFKELQNEIDKGEQEEVFFNRNEVFEKSKRDIVMELWKNSRHDEELRDAFQLILGEHKHTMTEPTKELKEETVPFSYKTMGIEILVSIVLIIIIRVFFE